MEIVLYCVVGLIRIVGWAMVVGLIVTGIYVAYVETCYFIKGKH